MSCSYGQRGDEKIGYTHYWGRKQDEIPLDKWREIRSKIEPILAAHASILDEVELTDERLWFNGVGEDAYETFVLDRAAPARAFNFCKTAMLPYDPVVVACLIVIASVLKGHEVKFRWDTDGSWPDDHQDGIAICGIPWNDVQGPTDE